MPRLRGMVREGGVGRRIFHSVLSRLELSLERVAVVRELSSLKGARPATSRKGVSWCESSSTPPLFGATSSYVGMYHVSTSNALWECQHLSGCCPELLQSSVTSQILLGTSSRGCWLARLPLGLWWYSRKTPWWICFLFQAQQGVVT